MKLKINETEIKLNEDYADAKFINSRQYEGATLSYELSIDGIYVNSDIFKILDSAFRNGDFVEVYAIHGNFELKTKMAVVIENIFAHENSTAAFDLISKD